MLQAILTNTSRSRGTATFNTLARLADSKRPKPEQSYGIASVSLDKKGEIIPEGKPISPSGTTFVELMIYNDSQIHGGYAFEPEGNKGALELFERSLDDYNRTLNGQS